MARNTQEAIEKTADDLETKLEPFIPEITVSTKPTVICGVQRKVNIGNYETIDIYCAVSIPQEAVDPKDHAALEEMVKNAAEIGFHLTSSEVMNRVKYIKENNKQ